MKFLKLNKTIKVALELSFLMGIGSLCAMETAEGEIQAEIHKLYNDQKNAAISKELRQRETVKNALQQLRRLKDEQTDIIHDEFSSQKKIWQESFKRVLDAVECSRNSNLLIDAINSRPPARQYAYIIKHFGHPHREIDCIKVNAACYSTFEVLQDGYAGHHPPTAIAFP